MAYEKLKQYLDKKGIQIKIKDKKKEKDVTPADIQKLMVQMLKDFGYLE